MQKSIVNRSTAGLVGVCALVGDGLMLRQTVEREAGGLVHGIWTDLMFFSDLSNLLVALVFLCIAFRVLRDRRPWWLGLALACVLLTAVGAQGWRGILRPLSGNTLVHTWTPLAVAVWCAVFAVKRRLRWGFVLSWTLVPLAYLAYALLRGTLTGVFAYPWLDPSKVGTRGLIINVAVQLLIFVLIAAVIVTVDRFRPRSRMQK